MHTIGACTPRAPRAKNVQNASKRQFEYANVLLSSGHFCAFRPARVAINVDTDLVGKYVSSYKHFMWMIDTRWPMEWAFFKEESDARRFCNLAPGESQACHNCAHYNLTEQRSKYVQPPGEEALMTVHILRGECRLCHSLLRSVQRGTIVEHATHLDWYESLPDKNKWVVIRDLRNHVEPPSYCDEMGDDYKEYRDYQYASWARDFLDPDWVTKATWSTHSGKLPSKYDDPETYGRKRNMNFELVIFDKEVDAARYAGQLEDYYEAVRLRKEERKAKRAKARHEVAETTRGVATLTLAEMEQRMSTP